MGLGAVLLIGAGAAIGWFARPAASLTPGLYGLNRLVAVQVQLTEAPPDYVLVAGDSHAEFQGAAQRLCGREVVNAGLGGATAAIYAALFPRLTVPVRARMAILTIGTNDLKRKNAPASEAGLARFAATVEGIVRDLGRVSDRVVVTAVPPIGRAVGDRLDAEAVELFSRRLRDLCGRLGCTFADPFAALRDGTSGYALPGALRDDVHLARYRQAQRALEPLLCPAP